MVFLISISLLVILSGCAQPADAGNPPIPAPPATPAPPTSGEPNIILITSSGFFPSTITITQGETITFRNTDTNPHWPASAVHPTHNAYPEGGGCLGSAFDACRGLSNGEEFSFTFNHVGEWKYHDHLAPHLFGTIIVQEG